eukprot:m.233731 g.233731  ORF g.233731 m.233731 type:complete len:479 (+) comp12558_c0_seq1:2-1438(+)
MKKHAPRTLLEQLASLDATVNADLDPEDAGHEDAYSARAAVGAEDDMDEVEVQPSKLRGRAPAALEDGAYKGKRSSRSALGFAKIESESEDDEDDGSGFESEDGDESNGESGDSSEAEELDEEELGGEGGNESYEESVNDEEDEDDGDDSEPGDEDDHLDAVMADSLRLRKEYEEMQKSELALMHKPQEVEDQAAKGKHTRAQLQLWDTMVEMRIRLQHVLTAANRLPRGEALRPFHRPARKLLTAAEGNAGRLLDTLVGLQDTLAAQSEGVFAEGSLKRPRGDDDCDDWEAVLAARHGGMHDFIHTTVDKWHKKTRLEGSRTQTKIFKALDQDIMAQVDKITADRGRLVTRTRVLRTPLKVVGQAQAEPSTDAATAPPTDVELFDDGDFYQDLLRELIERKSANIADMDSTAMGRHWLEMNALRTKIKRKVDTKASKGRKVRYEVHAKLVNFMAPDERAYPAPETARDDLFASLFRS